MPWFQAKFLTMLAAWASAAAYAQWPAIDNENLAARLSSTTKIYLPGSNGFNASGERWSYLEAPKVNIVVVPATENDVVQTVKFAALFNLPFLAFNGVHGAITTLGRMDYGIEIDLSQLSSVQIAPDGMTAKIGGGTLSKTITDTLWPAGKETVTGTCECVSYLGPALGGGHGWLQGHYGLASDQLVSANIVLADGTLRTVDAQSDLWWAIRGAGHNFGIVTSVTSKIYPRTQTSWALKMFIFTGDRLEALYQATNDHLLKNGTQPVSVINYSYWVNIPAIDPNAPVMVFYIIQEGTTAVSPTFTSPFDALGPVSTDSLSGTYRDLAAWTGSALDSPVCVKGAGLANPRFPIYLKTYNTTAQRLVYNLYASAVSSPGSPFSDSSFLWEGYSTQGVKSIDSASSAYAFRGVNDLLIAPTITYTVTDAARDAQARVLGNQLRELLRQGSGSAAQRAPAYVNYAYGDEGPKGWYGEEEWRQARLRGLKRKYDRDGRFSFYAPIL
ncbi:FAD-dependent oxygenase [Podospora didyma]|uniref:FAD-dependent oxygenase n=1 Tax=Podospora didyma TaxID=330526 RepID=A0AAE0NGX6_9PEZI|nr:FAD-dependent oxygenase [Podospora didyma]